MDFCKGGCNIFLQYDEAFNYGKYSIHFNAWVAYKASDERGNTLNFDDLDYAMNEDSAIDNSLMLETQESNMMIREDARRSTNTALERMIKICIWKNDYMEFEIGNRVQIRPDTDANIVENQTNVRTSRY
ncbi:hypothetical protein COBT_000146 [Conglomerata obtusa]